MHPLVDNFPLAQQHASVPAYSLSLNGAPIVPTLLPQDTKYLYGTVDWAISVPRHDKDAVASKCRTCLARIGSPPWKTDVPPLGYISLLVDID